MKPLTVLTTFASFGLVFASAIAPRGKKLRPFLETIEKVSTSSLNLQLSVQNWDGLPMGGLDIVNNASAVTTELKDGIERIRGARRLHAVGELRLKKHMKKMEATLFDTLQIFVLNKRRFEEAMAEPTVRETLDTHKDLSSQLNKILITKFGRIGRRALRKLGEMNQTWFDETREIFAKEKDKNPEEDNKRRENHREWKHITKPTEI